MAGLLGGFGYGGWVSGGRGASRSGDHTVVVVNTLWDSEKDGAARGQHKTEVFVYDRTSNQLIDHAKIERTGEAARTAAAQMQDRAEADIIAAVERSCEAQGRIGKRSRASGRPNTGGWGSRGGEFDNDFGGHGSGGEGR
jgi:hypothetical protein